MPWQGSRIRCGVCVVKVAWVALWSREWGGREHAGGKGTATWLLQDRYSGGLDGVAGSEKGEEPMKWRDIWEVGSAGLSPKPPLGKIILVCSTTCVNEIISKYVPTPPSNPTADWLRLFLVCP